MHSLSKGHFCNPIGDTPPKKRISIHGLLNAIALCSVSIFTMPALATLTTPISVNLISPGGTTSDSTPLAFSEPLTYATPIAAGGSGAIGGFMLPNEQISLSGDSIRIRAAQGDLSGGTGYLGLGGAHARYEFNGLSIAGRVLTSIDVFAFDGYLSSGTSGVLSGIGVNLIDTDANSTLDTLIFNLDDLLFDPRFGAQSSLNFAEFRIDILSRAGTQPPNPNGVPEPGSLMLASAALLALRFVSRRRTADNAKA